VVHVDGSARIQTVSPADEPLMARVLEQFAARTGVPVVVNTSLNTAGRPMVDDPRDALECFGSAPIDLLAIGPFVVRRPRPRIDLRRTAEPTPALA
jgi:carbamoyltransferase